MKSEDSRKPAARSARRTARPSGYSKGWASRPASRIGPAHVVEAGAVTISEYEIDEDKVDAELERFHGAVAEVARSSCASCEQGRRAARRRGRGARLPARGAPADADRLARDARRRDPHRASSGSTPKRRCSSRSRKVAQDFAALDDPYLAARADDVREVGDRLMRNLTQTPYAAFTDLPEGAIVVAEELTPADTALLDPSASPASRPSWAAPKATPRSWRARSACRRCSASPELLRMSRAPGDRSSSTAAPGRVVVNPSAGHARGVPAPARCCERDEQQLGAPAQPARRHPRRRSAIGLLANRRAAARGGAGDATPARRASACCAPSSCS